MKNNMYSVAWDMDNLIIIIMINMDQEHLTLLR